MTALIAPNISFGISPLKDSTNRVASIFKLMRVRAMSQTSALRIRQTSATQLIVERARNCADPTWEREPSFTDEDLNLNEASNVKGMAQHDNIQIFSVIVDGTTYTSLTSSNSPCFNSRGLTNRTVRLTLKNTRTNQTKDIEVFRGGGVKVYDS
jgi:hypothetical protein